MMQPLQIGRPEENRPPPVDVVQMVWRCRTNRLSGQDKRAYEFLYKETSGGRQSVLITPGDISADQGTTDDTGRTRLKNLKQEGLVDYRPAQKRGSYEIWLLDPFAALRALGVADPQLDLPFENTSWEGLSESQAGRPGDTQSSQDGNYREDLGQRIGLAEAEEPPPTRPQAEEPREVPPEDPRRNFPRRPSGPSEEARAQYRPLTIRRPSEPSGRGSLPVALAGEEPRRGTSGGSSPDEDLEAVLARRREQLGIVPSGHQGMDPLEVARVASVAAAITRRLPRETEQARLREHWIHTIRVRVKDPALKDCVMVKVACAIVRGELEADVVEEILANLARHQREGTLTSGSPGKYFFFAVRRAFEERGLTWNAYHKPKPR